MMFAAPTVANTACCQPAPPATAETTAVAMVAWQIVLLPESVPEPNLS